VGAANSAFDISYNTIAADNASTVQLDHAGVYLEPSNFAGLENNRLSQFSIHDNTILVKDTCGCYMAGMLLFDWDAFPANEPSPPNPGPQWFRAAITHNTISLPGNYVLGLASGDYKEGIDTITATPTGTYDAISLWGNFPAWLPATGNSIFGNNVSGVALDPSYIGVAPVAQYILDTYTNNNTLICANRNDTALNQGTENTVIGCEPAPTAVATSGVTPNVSTESPIGRFKMPRHLP
jgi:hypothetical protein